MSWVIVRGGWYRYLKSEDPLRAYSEHQKEAIRFRTKREARQAMRWEACLHSTRPCRIVKLTPRHKRLEEENERLRGWVLRLSQMPLDWTSQETQRRAKDFWRQLENGPTQSNSEETQP